MPHSQLRLYATKRRDEATFMNNKNVTLHTSCEACNVTLLFSYTATYYLSNSTISAVRGATLQPCIVTF